MTDDEPIFNEAVAREVVRRAVQSGEEAKLLNCLTDGGIVTVDVESQRLFYITAEQLAKAARG